MNEWSNDLVNEWICVNRNEKNEWKCEGVYKWVNKFVMSWIS